jgi:isoleucyl-tRNA synthetase
VALPRDISQKLIESHEDVILEELNVKELKFVKEAFDIIERQVTPNAKILGPKYGKDVQTIIQKIKAGNFEVLGKDKVKVGDFILEGDEVMIGFKGKEGFDVESDEGIVVVLDTNLTEDLKKEGFAREIVRFIQELRKETDYQVDDRILVMILAEGKVGEAVTEFADYISKETLANEIISSGGMEWDAEKSVEIEGIPVKIAVKKA